MAIQSFPLKIHKVDQVRAATTTGGISLQDDLGNLGLTVEDGGQIGIGTATPSADLEVVGSLKQSTGTVTIESNGNATVSAAAAMSINSLSNTHAINVGNENRNGPINIATNGDRVVTIGEDGNTSTEVVIRSEGGLTLDAGADTAAITGDVTVTGSCTAASFSGDGSALTGVGAGDITAVSLTGDSGGTLTVASGAAGFSVLGGSGLTSSGAGTTITLAGDDATTSAKGVASFSSSDFSVSSGAVSLADLTTTHIAAATLVTEAEGIGSNDNDTTLPTSAAVKDYVDNNATGVVRFALSAKLYTSVADSSNIYVTPNADNTYPLKWTTYVTNQDIGAIGDTVDTVLNYGYYTLRHMALMAAPVNCRLKALSFAFDLQSPDDEATSLKVGVFRGDYAAGSDGSETSRTAVHTWTTLGTASHTVGTGSGDTVDGQLIRGSATFTHTSTDIAAGQPIGFGLESFGTADAQGINITRGVVTALFEAT